MADHHPKRPIMKTHNTQRFWDKIAPKYARKPVPNLDTYETKLRLTQEKMTPEMKVLEIGCGTGTTALHHAPKVSSILATDVSSGMLYIAQQKASQQGIKNVNFQCAAVHELKLKPESFDLVMAHSLLHLLDDMETVVRDMYKALKPGGWFISSTVCMGDKLSFFKWIAPLGKWLGLMPNLNIFTRDDLRSAITDAGFEIDHDWQPNDGHSLFLMARKPENS
jgi:ubiquinone/menaquinone biosynthesis C-methylase UbiE